MKSFKTWVIGILSTLLITILFQNCNRPNSQLTDANSVGLFNQDGSNNDADSTIGGNPGVDGLNLTEETWMMALTVSDEICKNMQLNGFTSNYYYCLEAFMYDNAAARALFNNSSVTMLEIANSLINGYVYVNPTEKQNCHQQIRAYNRTNTGANTGYSEEYALELINQASSCKVMW